MGRKTGPLLRLLLVTAHIYAGVSAYATEDIYLTVGDHATLKCANVQYTNCSSTTWIYDSPGSDTVELVTLGKVKERRTNKRLSVESTCSLHISNLHAKDAGLYTCRQYLKNDGPQYGADAPVLLSILNMSELNPGSTVTLHCVLFTDADVGQCFKHSVRKPNLSWKAEEGTELVNPRYQVKHVTPCYTTLTVTLQQTDNNRKWICQLTVDSEMKTSHSYTTILSGNPGGKGTTTVSTTSPPNSPSATGTTTIVVAVVVGCMVLCIAVAVIVIYRRRRPGVIDNHKTTNQDTGQSVDTVTYSVISHSVARPKEKDRDTAEQFTEYASVNVVYRGCK